MIRQMKDCKIELLMIRNIVRKYYSSEAHTLDNGYSSFTHYDTLHAADDV